MEVTCKDVLANLPPETVVGLYRSNGNTGAEASSLTMVREPRAYNFKAKRKELEETSRRIAGAPLWTDDFSNIWMIFHWKR